MLTITKQALDQLIKANTIHNKGTLLTIALQIELKPPKEPLRFFSISATPCQKLCTQIISSFDFKKIPENPNEIIVFKQHNFQLNIYYINIQSNTELVLDYEQTGIDSSLSVRLLNNHQACDCLKYY